MAALFSPLQLRSLVLPNRILVSPMCQYSSANGIRTSGISCTSEATRWAERRWCSSRRVASRRKAASRPGTRASGPGTTRARGIPSRNSFVRTARFPRIQIAHAGRKASCRKPWEDGKPLGEAEGAWETLGPSAIAFGSFPPPRAITLDEIANTVDDFRRAAEYSLQAGFDAIEVHGAHGSLIHTFLSPLSNRRTDEYGGSLENRMRFPLAVGEAVRRAWPDDKPVFYRISATDWAEGGWDLAQSIEFTRRLKTIGIDMIDCSSGGNIHGAHMAIGPGYQVPFSAAIRKEVSIPTAAVGLITEPVQAEQIVALGEADAVSLAPAFLRDPYWPRHAAKALGVEFAWPDQYKRAG